MLLLSRSARSPDGLGAASGALGRYLMDHVLVKASGLGPPLSQGAYLTQGRCLYLPRFDARELPAPRPGRGFGVQWHQSPAGGERSYFGAFGEMLPRSENRVTLDPVRRDAWGIPVLRIDCAHGDRELLRAREQVAALRELAELAGVTLTRIDEAPWPPGLAIHECGTARMGSDPANSVLDPHNQCWEAKGLYVTDGACFPSQGSQNPTLTILALTARACDHALRTARGNAEGMPKTGGAQPQAQKPAAAALQAKLNQGMALHRQGKLADAERYYGEVLQWQPDHFSALHLLGVIARQTRRTERGVALIKRAIGLNPKVAEAHISLGIALRDLQRPAEALASYDKAIVLKPDYAVAHYNRGNALRDLQRSAEALASYDTAIALKLDVAEVHNNRGNALRDLKRFEEALASYDKAIALKPDHTEAHSNRGNALTDLKRPAEALASYDRAIALKLDVAEVHNNRGNALRDLKRFEEALASYDKAIVLKPDYAVAHYNRGNALMDLKRPAEALASCDKAIVLKPDFAEAHSNRGNALMDLKRPAEALASYDKAIALKPDFAAAHSNRGNALTDLKRFEEALASYDKAIALKPDHTEAHSNRGNVLYDLKRYDEAFGGL